MFSIPLAIPKNKRVWTEIPSKHIEATYHQAVEELKTVMSVFTHREGGVEDYKNHSTVRRWWGCEKFLFDFVCAISTESEYHERYTTYFEAGGILANTGWTPLWMDNNPVYLSYQARLLKWDILNRLNDRWAVLVNQGRATDLTSESVANGFESQIQYLLFLQTGESDVRLVSKDQINEFIRQHEMYSSCPYFWRSGQYRLRMGSNAVFNFHRIFDKQQSCSVSDFQTLWDLRHLSGAIPETVHPTDVVSGMGFSAPARVQAESRVHRVNSNNPWGPREAPEITINMRPLERAMIAEPPVGAQVAEAWVEAPTEVPTEEVQAPGWGQNVTSLQSTIRNMVAGSESMVRSFTDAINESDAINAINAADAVEELNTYYQ
jgi:hypothetical protein